MMNVNLYILGLCGSKESKNRSTKKSGEVDHMKKKKEDSEKRSLFTMMNNVLVSMGEARAMHETLTSLSVVYYHI
mgnify:FL=1